MVLLFYMSRDPQKLLLPGHVMFVTDRLVRACAELPKLCEFFHIPFQSGDDDILRAMARGYTAARYKSIIDNIRRYMPDASISGDAIVGFPGQGPGCGKFRSAMTWCLLLQTH